MKKTVFLGGTCNGSTWRDSLIPLLLTANAFNPVVSEWNEAAQKAEEEAKANCDVMLYVLTPKSNSPYSIAEVVNDSNKRPEKVVFAFIEPVDDGSFTDHERKALNKIGEMVEENGAKWCKTLDEVIDTLNAPVNANSERATAGVV